MRSRQSTRELVLYSSAMYRRVPSRPALIHLCDSLLCSALRRLSSTYPLCCVVLLSCFVLLGVLKLRSTKQGSGDKREPRTRTLRGVFSSDIRIFKSPVATRFFFDLSALVGR